MPDGAADEIRLYIGLDAALATAQPASALLPAQVSRQIVTLLDLWLAAVRAERGLPHRDALDVLEIASADPRIVPHLWVLNVERNPRLLRFRLVGGAVLAGGAVAPVGHPIELANDKGGSAEGLWKAVDERAAVYRAGVPNLAHDGAVTGLEVVCLPVRSGVENRVDRLINCTVYKWQEGYRGT